MTANDSVDGAATLWPPAVVRTPNLVCCLVVLAIVASAGCRRDEAPAAAPDAGAAPARKPPPSALDLPAAASGDKVDLAALTPGFVRVPGTRALLGSPAGEVGRSADEQQHEVTIRNSFEMQATEVTIEEYERLIGRNPAAREGCPRCPVEQVSWFEAAHYCNELSRRRGLPICTTIDPKQSHWRGPSCRGFRLPTEAEWEWAARGGTTAERYGPLDQVAWIDANAGLRTHEVATKEPNIYGLFDMIGNVAEWVWDWKDTYPTAPSIDPVGPAAGDNRGFRGGAARWAVDEARSAFRNGYGPGNKVEFIGFRCVRTLGP